MSNKNIHNAQPASAQKDRGEVTSGGPPGRDAYWADFYKDGNAAAPAYPSQFAAFAINEMAATDGVIEFGCGNGRDSHFFATHGHRTLALDASCEAIALCRSRNPYAHARYVESKASSAGQEVASFIRDGRPVAVYARFFLHAIDDQEQQAFLDLLDTLLPNGSLLLLEYRTVGDEMQEKAFGTDHYRRYLKHRHVLNSINKSGFSIMYQIESQGLAKYKNEDARVGRCLAIKERP